MPQDWNQRLKTAYKRSGREPHRPVRLPAEGVMSVAGDADHAVIDLESGAIVRNMQDNAAAFEGWSLALRHWCGAEKVTLRWQPPVVPLVLKKDDLVRERHYQRFLYRVERFSSLFNWFDVATPDLFARWRHLYNKEYFLNVAGNGPNTPSDEVAESSMAKPEYDLECRLQTDPDFHKHYKFAREALIDRQFPVGLFSEATPTAASAVFPGGKGAIDLVCLDHRHLWLFELKAEKNIPIGTIAELLFYGSVMRDAVMGKFKFGRIAGGRAKVRPEMLGQVNEITGVMLGHDLHPLISDPKLIGLLNNAVENQWNCIDGAPLVSFRADKIQEDQKDRPLKIVECGR